MIQNRRDFIRQLALAGSAVSLAATPWIGVFARASQAGKGPGDRVRLAFIGTGSRGKELLRNLLPYLQEENSDVVALCDNFAPHLDDTLSICAASGRKPAVYADYRRMIEKEKPDGVIIATPLHEHAHITIDCLQHGIHVFCEKAMARTLDDTLAMYRTHLETRRILQIGHQRLFHPVYIEGMQRIHNGDLGVIGQIRAYWHRNNDWRRPLPDNNPAYERQINWRLYKEYSAGLLTELMSHQIHVASWALQQSPVSVMGTGCIRYWNDGREVDDNIALIFTYPDKTPFIYDSMISNRKYGLEEQILGSTGTIEFEVNRCYSEDPPPLPGIQQLINDIGNGIFSQLSIGSGSWAPETAVETGGEALVAGKMEPDTALQLEAFIRFIRQGSAPEAMMRGAYEANIWTLLAETAIEKGEKVTLPDSYRTETTSE
ncbi:MAG TPA: Gfo/Idh/MocA family oxidoreductase [Prolixibacteraceae bacterium]|nr:Gfo/Idh/MocA family oxidoreductase [Prolixibacteraceae bacterium]